MQYHTLAPSKSCPCNLRERHDAVQAIRAMFRLGLLGDAAKSEPGLVPGLRRALRSTLSGQASSCFDVDDHLADLSHYSRGVSARGRAAPFPKAPRGVGGPLEVRRVQRPEDVFLKGFAEVPFESGICLGPAP